MVGRGLGAVAHNSNPSTGRDTGVSLGLSDWLNSNLACLVSVKSINNAVPKQTNKQRSSVAQSTCSSRGPGSDSYHPHGS